MKTFKIFIIPLEGGGGICVEDNVQPKDVHIRTDYWETQYEDAREVWFESANAAEEHEDIVLNVDEDLYRAMTDDLYDRDAGFDYYDSH